MHAGMERVDFVLRVCGISTEGVYFRESKAASSRRPEGARLASPAVRRHAAAHALATSCPTAKATPPNQGTP
jgi:hypothetical protein